jgi:uncharacterized protein YndB with AHSA1/START domain
MGVTTFGYTSFMSDIVATAEIDIAASGEAVWAALTEPAQIKEYMFGSTVETDWQPGSAITWSGEYNGKPYEDKGEIIAVEPGRRLELTHFSPMSGADDVPENYHRLNYTLSPVADGTHVELTQDNNADTDAAEHATKNWQAMLDGLKRQVEG